MWWRKKQRIRDLRITSVQLLYGLAALVVLVAMGLMGWFGYEFFGSMRASVGAMIDPNPHDAKSGVYKDCQLRRLVDGVCVGASREVAPRLVGVMIENAADAWPLSGLSLARVVYEASVEGNIPRFLAIYVEDELVKEVGPVRSARPYYVDWVSEYGGAMYMHVGGSPEALKKIEAAADIFAVNEFYRGWYFWRSDDRPMPHNTYTSRKLWKKAWEDYGKVERVSFEPWHFTSMDPCVEDCVQEVTISFLSPTYNARWVYTTSTEQYERYQNGQRQTDRNGTPVVADTIIVERTKVATIDDIGRKRIDTIGQGEVMVFRNGYVIEGEWRKASRLDRTQFFTKQDEPIALQPGKIWVEVVGVTTPVVF